MSLSCRYCGSELAALQDAFVTGGLCAACADDVLSTLQNTQRFIDSLGEPILFMQGDPRLVLAANQRAGALFGKDPGQMRGLRGGQVFDCIHSLSDLGCGLDPNCQDCKIKTAVVETFTQKKSSARIYTILDIVREKQTTPYHLEVSTEPLGEFALIRIDRFRPTG